MLLLRVRDNMYNSSSSAVWGGKKTEVGKIEGEREVQQAWCCCVCEKVCTTVVEAPQFGVYAVYVCAIQQQQQFIDE